MNRAGEDRQEIMNELRKDGYSEIVIDHWLTPRNFGQMQKYDGYSNKFKGSCGDSMWVWIKVNNDIIQEASYISDVCIGSITCGSILTEMIKGKSIGSALRISQDDILKELGGLPAQFAHCAKLAKDTLNLAIIDYNAYKIHHGKEPTRRSNQSAVRCPRFGIQISSAQLVAIHIYLIDLSE